MIGTALKLSAAEVVPPAYHLEGRDRGRAGTGPLPSVAGVCFYFERLVSQQKHPHQGIRVRCGEARSVVANRLELLAVAVSGEARRGGSCVSTACPHAMPRSRLGFR